MPGRNVGNVAKAKCERYIEPSQDVACSRLLFAFISAHYTPFVCCDRRVLIWIEAAIVMSTVLFSLHTISA